VPPEKKTQRLLDHELPMQPQLSQNQSPTLRLQRRNYTPRPKLSQWNARLGMHQRQRNGCGWTHHGAKKGARGTGRWFYFFGRMERRTAPAA
jgi:hypothetical protein